MGLLQKYHKQKPVKMMIRKYDSLSKQYALNLKAKEPYDYLKLSLFETALANKSTIEQTFEAIRSKNLDMWENLSFNERNFIVKCDNATQKAKMKKFIFEEQAIYIPFFDKLLNTLYDRETAILELPQYFKLYNDFNARIQLDLYGFEPYKANMSCAHCIASDATTIVLYDKKQGVFYKISDDAFKQYPILQGIPVERELLETLGHALLDQSDTGKFLDLLIQHEMISKRCVKKIEKLKKKDKEIVL